MVRKKHWETVYETKLPNEVSWTQEIPKISLKLIDSFKLSKTAKIIDVGGGDSKLVDYLLQEGFENISILDISEKALEKAKKRLGGNAKKIKWIACDIAEYEPDTIYDVWHDRATFHFLTTNKEITKYLETAKRCVGGYLILGTFSEDGPNKCSGLAIKQYSEKTLTAQFRNGFTKLQCLLEEHTTPFNTTQNFLFCSFTKTDNI